MPFDEETDATLADLVGTVQELEFEGKSYKIRKPNIDEMALFGRWLERRALEAVARAVYLPESAQEKLYQAVVEQMSAGCFEYFSKAGYAAQATAAGQAKLLQLILSAEHPEVTEEFALRMVERAQREIGAILGSGGNPDHPKAPEILAAAGLESNFLSSSYATRLFASLAARSGDSPSPNSSTSSA